MLRSTESGIRGYVIKKEGTGNTPPCRWNKSNSSLYGNVHGWSKILILLCGQRSAFEFTVGARQVITGWDETVLAEKGGAER